MRHHQKPHLSKDVAAIFSVAVLLILLAAVVPAAEVASVLTSDMVVVYFSDGRRDAAQQIVALSPSLFRELEQTTDLRFDFRPTVIAAPNRSSFLQMGGRAVFAAFARPKALQVVVDLSRFDRQPESFGPVLKHEYAHLLLHRHIAPQRLPRWLDEGIAQHLSDGISEYLPGRSQLVLGEALAADRAFPLAALAAGFPDDDAGLQLAYEQSRSVVDYLVRRFGEAALKELIAGLAAGTSPAAALRTATGISPATLEGDWRRHETTPLAWLGRLAGQAYGIIFFLAALATMLAFIRYRRRRQAYDDHEDGDEI